MGPGTLGQVARAVAKTMAQGPNFQGHWFTSFGPMELNQNRNTVDGQYVYQGTPCAIAGTIDNGKLIFDYHEPNVSGEGWFQLERHGKFTGQWRPHGIETWSHWEGVREWEGLWNTSFGPMRLMQTPEGVFGFYDGVGPASINGQIEEGRLVFRYQEPKVQGEGVFELAPDGQQFKGEWKEEGKDQWALWTGRRIHPVPGLQWLVVLEAHWQRSLMDKEYAFGHMLREFFARLPNVQVRQRFFDSEGGLEKWCRELIYLAEPAIVLIASHGTAEGLSALGKTVNPQAIVDGLKYADGVQLLHFSSCLMMQDGQAGELARRLQRECRFPISGYTTSVDWAASALLEFHYLDLILGRGLSPEQAAEQVAKMLSYAGDQVVPCSPYPAAGFRFFAPVTN